MGLLDGMRLPSTSVPWVCGGQHAAAQLATRCMHRRPSSAACPAVTRPPCQGRQAAEAPSRAHRLKVDQKDAAVVVVHQSGVHPGAAGVVNVDLHSVRLATEREVRVGVDGDALKALAVGVDLCWREHMVAPWSSAPQVMLPPPRRFSARRPHEPADVDLSCCTGACTDRTARRGPAISVLLLRLLPAPHLEG
jgi:hypothetical protein